MVNSKENTDKVSSQIIYQKSKSYVLCYYVEYAAKIEEGAIYVVIAMLS